MKIKARHGFMNSILNINLGRVIMVSDPNDNLGKLYVLKFLSTNLVEKCPKLKFS